MLLNLKDEDDAHEGEIQHLDFHPDGSLLASTGADRKLKIWEVSTGRLLTAIVLGGQGNMYPAFHPDGRSLVVTGDHTTLRFDLSGLREQTQIAQHDYPIHGFAFSSDDRFLTCAAEMDRGSNEWRAGEATVWSREGKLVEKKEWGAENKGGHRTKLSLAYHPGGDALIYSGPLGRGFHVWDLTRGTVTESEPKSILDSFAFNSDGSMLWAAGAPARVSSWQWPGLKVRPPWLNPSAGIRSMSGITSVAAGRSWTVVGCNDATTKLLCIDEGKIAMRTEWPSPQALQLDRAAAKAPRVGAIFNPDKGSNGVLSVAMAKDESLAASGTQSGAVQVAAIPSGATFGQVLRGHTDAVRSVAFSPAGDYLASGSRDRTVRLWRRQDQGFHEMIVLPAPGPVVKVEFTPDGKRLGVLVQEERAVRMWQLDRLLESLGNLGLN